MSLIYLASPYSHEDPKVREERYKKVVIATAQLTLDGRLVFSPIVHGHPITENLISRGKTEQYLYSNNETWCITMIKKCDELCILMLEGWRESKGIMNEIKIAETLGMRITYLNFYVGIDNHVKQTKIL